MRRKTWKEVCLFVKLLLHTPSETAEAFVHLKNDLELIRQQVVEQSWGGNFFILATIILWTQGRTVWILVLRGLRSRILMLIMTIQYNTI